MEGSMEGHDRDLPLNALRVLAVVRSAGGVRAAARELGIVHSSVSRHLRELERWLGGVPLRGQQEGRTGLTLSAEGDRLAAAVALGLGEIESAVAALRERRPAHAVVIGTAPSFAARWLLPRLPDLERSHPHLEVSVVVEKSLRDPAATSVDLGIRMGAGPWPGVGCEPLADDSLYPVMSADYWRRAGRPSRLDDLEGLRLLHDRDPHATWAAWHREHGPAALAVSHGPRFTSTDLVLRAASQGQGVALARHRLASADLEAGRLCRPFGDLAVAVPDAYWLLRPLPARRGEALETVVAWLRRHVEAQARPEAVCPPCA